MSENTVPANVSEGTRRYLREWADAVNADVKDVAGDAIEQFLINQGHIDEQLEDR